MSLKKSILFLLIFSLSFTSIGFTCMDITGNARNNGTIKLVGNEAEIYISDFAKEVADSFEPNLNLIVKNIKPIRNTDGNIVSYTCSYQKGKDSYGYIVLKNENDELIPQEFNFSKGTESLLNEIVDNVEDENSSKDFSINSEIFELAPLQYCINVKNKRNNKSEVYDSYEKQLKGIEISSTKYKNQTIIFIKDFSSKKYKIDNSQTITLSCAKNNQGEYKLLSMKNVEQVTSKYCCAVSVISQIAYMKNLYPFKNQNDFIKATYNKLWKYANVSTVKKKYEPVLDKYITIGSANSRNAASGLVKYAKERGYKNSYYSTKTNPSVAWIKTNLKSNKPILMAYTIELENGNTSSHGISILGYKRAKKLSSGKTYNYLMVYDAWNDSIKHLNYTDVDFTSCEAESFTIKK